MQIEFKSFGFDDKKVSAVGDTRFDRVYQRSLLAKEKRLINYNVLKGKKVLVAGSTWEQDEEVIFPAFLKLASVDNNVLMIVAPHEPTLLHLEKIENEFAGKLKTIRFSHLNNYANETNYYCGFYWDITYSIYLCKCGLCWRKFQTKYS